MGVIMDARVHGPWAVDMGVKNDACVHWSCTVATSVVNKATTSKAKATTPKAKATYLKAKNTTTFPQHLYRTINVLRSNLQSSLKIS